MGGVFVGSVFFASVLPCSCSPSRANLTRGGGRGSMLLPTDLPAPGHAAVTACDRNHREKHGERGMLGTEIPLRRWSLRHVESVGKLPKSVQLTFTTFTQPVPRPKHRHNPSPNSTPLVAGATEPRHHHPILLATCHLHARFMPGVTFCLVSRCHHTPMSPSPRLSRSSPVVGSQVSLFGSDDTGTRPPERRPASQPSQPAIIHAFPSMDGGALESTLLWRRSCHTTLV